VEEFMRKYKIFDVVELYDGNRATIVSVDGDFYKVKVTDKNGQDVDTRYIRYNEIKSMVVWK